MTTKTSPRLEISFIREDGHHGHIWATKVETVWGDEERGEFAGFICTEYQTGKIWKIANHRVTGIKKGVSWIELA